MARAIRSGANRVPSLPAADRGNYLREVWEELKKVVWPTRTELSRMTGIVVATVILFAGIIGVADYGLGIAVKQLYAPPGTRAVQPQQRQTLPNPGPNRSRVPTPVPLPK